MYGAPIFMVVVICLASYFNSVESYLNDIFQLIIIKINKIDYSLDYKLSMLEAFHYSYSLCLHFAYMLATELWLVHLNEIYERQSVDAVG